MLKRLFLLNLFFLTLCFSHQEETAILNIISIDDTNIKIEVLDSRTKKEIYSNQVKIISLKSGEILNEFLLSKENQVINTPKEDYYVLVKVANNLVYKRDASFGKIFIFVSCFIFFISLVIYLLRIKKYDKLNYN
mgnify:CR=1 FL=1